MSGALLPNWSEAKTEDGRSYYYHVVTKETTWERPVQAPSGPVGGGAGVNDVFHVDMHDLGNLHQQAPQLGADTGRQPLVQGGGMSSSTSGTFAPIQTTQPQAQAGAAQPPAAAAPAKEPPTGMCACFQVEYYQQFFNVDTINVQTRLLRSMTPWSNVFFEETSTNPDLYGPFWVCTTLIVMLAIAGNVARYLQDSKAAMDPTSLVIAASIVYSFGFFFPSILWFTMYRFGSKTTLISVICTYGYSLFIFVPITALAMIPSEIFRWIMISLGLLLSQWFLLGHYAKEMSQYLPKAKYLILFIAFLGQTALILTFKLYFFGMMGLSQNNDGK